MGTEHFPGEEFVLDKEERWFEQGVRDSNWERVEQAAINKKGGLRFRLPRRLAQDIRSDAWWSPVVLDVTSQSEYSKIQFPVLLDLISNKYETIFIHIGLGHIFDVWPIYYKL